MPPELSLDLAHFLLSEEAQKALADFSESDLESGATLTTLNKLRRTFSPERSGALLSQARLRVRAAAKFPHAQRMVFTRDALEQATAWPVALHRAAWIDRAAPAGPVLDLGCGIGGDTLALAQFRDVVAYETDPVRLLFAQANARELGTIERIEFRCADWVDVLTDGGLPTAAAAFADPSRRAGDRRVFSLHRMQPPLNALLKLHAFNPNLAVKVMPGVAGDEVPAGCGVEFVSHQGVCKEAILWFGDLARHTRWASVHSGEGWHSLVSAGASPAVGPLWPGAVLYEPDPAVIRAGAFAELCQLLDARLIDPQIAYLVADELHRTPFATPFIVRECHPFNLKRLNTRLRDLGVSSVELKKRGAPFAPESIRPRLKLASQGAAGVVLFTRQKNAPIMIIAQRP